MCRNEVLDVPLMKKLLLKRKSLNSAPTTRTTNIRNANDQEVNNTSTPHKKPKHSVVLSGSNKCHKMVKY